MLLRCFVPHGTVLITFAVIIGINTACANARGRRSVYMSGDKHPPVILELGPGSLDYPGLKEFYAALQGHLPQDGVYLQLGPRKREVGENEASFALRVNPALPRNPSSVKRFNTTSCEEQKKTWCQEVPPTSPHFCPPVDTPPPVPRTCGPTKPANKTSGNAYCRLQGSPFPVPKDLCAECPAQTGTQVTPAHTQYVPCVSFPPPTDRLRLKYCSPTPVPCRNEQRTNRLNEVNTLAPPTPPPCDACLSGAGEHPAHAESDFVQPAKYYVLVKRSPGGWAQGRRKRSSRMKKMRFRIVPELDR